MPRTPDTSDTGEAAGMGHGKALCHEHLLMYGPTLDFMLFSSLIG